MTLANLLWDLRASPSTGANRNPLPTMLDELKLEAEASPTVDQDRLLFSASLGGSAKVDRDTRVIDQVVQAQVLDLGALEHGTQRESAATTTPRHCQALRFKLQRSLPRSFGSAARDAPTVWRRGPWEVSTIQREQADEFRVLSPLAPTDVDISHLSMLPSTSSRRGQGWPRCRRRARCQDQAFFAGAHHPWLCCPFRGSLACFEFTASSFFDFVLNFNYNASGSGHISSPATRLREYRDL